MSVVETPKIKLPTHTPLSTPEWPIKNERHGNRAKELWSILRNSVKLLTDLMKKDDVKPSTITHGIHHQRKLNHDEPLRCVIYNAITEEIITVDNQFIRVFYRDGRRKDIIDPGDQIVDMIRSSKSNQYIALTSDQQMKLLNSDIEFISTATFQYKISCMICNESCNEVVTAGSGNVTSWCFRYGNKYLIPHKVITEGLTSNDVFDNITLEGSASKNQKCYASCGTGVAIFNLYQGKLLSYRRDLHVRNITSILFINPLKYVVTGSRDGSIKLWDSNFEVQHVFVGHHGPVQALSLYPLGPYFMSASYDSTIRLWSLETYDEVDLLETDEPNEGMSTVPELGHLFSYSSYMVDLWTISHIHQMFTSVGHDVFNMESISLSAKIPERVLTQSTDNIVRIISPTNGSVLTSLVPFQSFPSSKTKSNTEHSVKGNLVDAVYCVPRETVYAAYSDGSLVKAWTASNPATVQYVWKYLDGEYINCMCVYEYVLNNAELVDTWKSSQEKPKLPRQITRLPKYGNKTLLLVGRRDGCIANIDMNTGNILYVTEAHGLKGVIGILANTKNDQVISAGEDNVVKVWRIFPNTAEALSLLMSFYCAHTPRHMSIALSRLVVAFQQPETATYSIVVYDLETKERYDHSPDHDHTDNMTGLTFCSRLKLFASSSRDGTIRVWNHFNILIRTLKLNAEPKSIQFCSERGDLLVGLGGNIHRIEHQNYLPQAYIFKMVCMQFTDPIDENPIPLDETLTRNLSSEVLRCVKEAKSSYLKFNYAWDPMSAEELREVDEEERVRLKAFEILERREKELSGIRNADGSVEAKRKLRKSTKRTENRAFKKYMEMFYRPRKKVMIPEPDDFSPDPPQEKPQTPQEWFEERKAGFFPPISAVKPMKEIVEAAKDKETHFTESGPDYEPASKYIVNPTGFIPNSILAKFLWLQEDVEKQKEELLYKPPQFTEEQWAEINKKKAESDVMEVEENMAAPYLSLGKRKPSSSDIPTFEFNLATPSESGSLWEDEERDWDDDDAIDPSAGGKRKDAKKVEKKPSALMEKLRSAMKTPPPLPEPEPETPPPVARPPQVKAPKPPSKPIKPIVKLVSRPPPPPKPASSPPPQVVHSPTPPPRTPPHPASPSPNFLTQFQGKDWFEKYRDYIFERLRRPHVASQFCNIISDVMGIATDWDFRRAIVDALLMLWQQEDIVDTKHIINAINFVLNSSNPPSPKDPNQAAFLRSALKFMQAVLGATDEFILELLTQYLEGETTHKNFIKNILLQLGMRDSHNYLGKELETWEVWNLNETTSLKSQIKEIARKWMKEWTENFKVHLEQVLEELKKGDLKATIRKPPETPQSVLKTGSSRGSTQRGTPRVHFTLQATEQSLQNITSMEVINYFCEMSLEKELDRVKQTESKIKPVKNTVLVLPKLEGPQALVRLGEMHTAHRARQRNELAAEYKLNPLSRPYPDLMAGFASKIILPLSTMYMNPFPSPIDRFEMENVYQPVLLTLRSVHQRYFIPERSYVHLS
uniref:WD repeat-containing protein 97-like isoform X1 n=1 Tax=Styela clava TaxID=7725 RepID=UPI00193A3E3D|nr:WD repeat-containing protein 97-like isoform X1 [Styela clava]